MKNLFGSVIGFIRAHVVISVAAAITVTAASGVAIGFAVHNSRRNETGETMPSTTEHTHSYVAENVEATCGHGGYTLHSCECGDTYRTDEVEPLAHEYGEWVVTIPATATNDGQQEKHCLHCNHRLIEAIPQLKEHEHVYEDAIVKPTCTEKGFTQHTCSECGYVFSDSEIAATGHSWSAWKEVRAASTTGAGEKSRSCLICGKTVSESIPMIVQLHTHSYTETVIEPTCTEVGYTAYVCSCGDRYTANETPKRGHLYGNWETTKQPTAIEAGERQCVCSRCNYVHIESIDKLDAPTVNMYESYIDPRVEITKNGSGAVSYFYYPVGVIDSRSWGVPPTIQISDNGGFNIFYYKQDGTKVTYTLNPVEGYVNRLVILEDGSYTTSLIGDFND